MQKLNEIKNLHYLFYKEYYERLDTLTSLGGESDENNRHIESCNQKLLEYRLPKASDDGLSRMKARCVTHSFLMKIRYPGLLVGTGYSHESLKAAVDEVKLGFSFDYVTGMPCIPGSSVKGVLRSAFRHRGYVCELLSRRINEMEFERSIFGEDVRMAKKGNTMPVAQQDVFFDALPVKGDSKGQVIGFDYITPHNPKGLHNPKPIKLLKLMPGVAMEFRFRLRNTLCGDISLTADQKAELFEQILAQLGVGAKTNTGYGVLEPILKYDAL